MKTEESIFFPPQGRGSPTWRTTWPTLLRTMEIPMSVTAYNGKPYNSFLTGFFFACPLCGTSCCVFFGQAILVFSHSPFNPLRVNKERKPYIRYFVQRKALHPLLRTMEIPASVTAYNGNSYIRYCIQWKSLYPFFVFA